MLAENVLKMNGIYRTIMAFMVIYTCILGTACSRSAKEEKPIKCTHAEKARYSIKVKVEPVDIVDRTSDELVASYDMDLNSVLKGKDCQGAIDFASLKVVKYNPKTNEVEAYDNNYYQSSPGERMFRWYDADFPEDFPINQRDITAQIEKGEPLFSRNKYRKYGARHFNPSGSCIKGKLVWTHTQNNNEPSYYKIIFKVVNPDADLPCPPAGWVGDGSSRFLKAGKETGPHGNVKGTAVDYNDDGLVDVVYGNASGNVILYINTGTYDEPEFKVKKLLMNKKNEPIDVGWDSCPLMVDWNEDGKKDLLIGAERGATVYYKNVSTGKKLVFEYVRLLTSKGELLRTPGNTTPEVPGSEVVFKQDYMTNPCAVDWDGDGDKDYLAGGFVTGNLFYYENVGTAPDNTPTLVGGELMEADGEVIDVDWGAAATVADLDNDGDLDMVCGTKPITDTGGDTWNYEKSVRYFENIGTRKKPKLTERPFPRKGDNPFGGMDIPTLTDFDHDGDYDLVIVDVMHKTYFIKNIGTAEKPLFDVDVEPVTAYWDMAHHDMPVLKFVDYNNDGWPDIIRFFEVLVNSGKSMPGFFEESKSLVQKGADIRHPVKHGDENRWVEPFDFDNDGDLDFVYGTHAGYVYLHRNNGTNEKPEVDVAGEQLKLENGKNLKVGLAEGEEADKFNFIVLQGARPKPAPADYDIDGDTDLIIADTYGKVLFFKNVGNNDKPIFAEPILVIDKKGRVPRLLTEDYNKDGKPDLFMVKTHLYLFVNKSSEGNFKISEPEKINLVMPTGNFYYAAPVDYNRDGDVDFIYKTSHGGPCFMENSFSKHGYCEADMIAINKDKQDG